MGERSNTMSVEEPLLAIKVEGGEYAVLVDPVVELLKKLLPHGIQRQYTEIESSPIFRVSPTLRKGNESSYTPKLVSIGPYHHGKDTLKEMEQVKLKYLSDMVRRSPLDRYVRIVRDCAEDVANQYSGEVFPDDKFVMMMVVDGCFIIEFILNQWIDHEQAHGLTKESASLIQNDLLLVENQIPFFILEKLIREAYGSSNLTDAALCIFADNNAPPVGQRLRTSGVTFNHLLHLFHTSLNPCYQKKSRSLWEFAATTVTELLTCRSSVPIRFLIPMIIIGLLLLPLLIPLQLAAIIWQHIIKRTLSFLRMKLCGVHPSSPRYTGQFRIPNASYLRETGFIFKKKNSTSSFLDVSRRGKTIEIPALFIHQNTFSLFRNLIAMEHSSSLTDKENQRYLQQFTAYAILMDCLITTKEDVTMLKEYGIIVNGLRDDKMLASFFSNLCKEAHLKKGGHHHLHDLFCYVRDYCKEGSYRLKFYRWRKKLIPDYFTNPWAVPSMITASIFLGLSFMQAFFSIYAFYHRR